MEERKSNYKKELEEMNVIADFLFSEIMSDDNNGLEVCRIILNCVLKRKVGNISFTAQRVIPGVSEKSHGIRLDVYITENNDNGDDIKVYDIEPDRSSFRKRGLPRRSRYYGDLIDVQLLNTGTEYENLPELVNIFILSYDPFGEDSMYYEAVSVLKTHPHVDYNDGIRRIFLYVDGKIPDNAGDTEYELRNLLKYISKSTIDNVTDDNTRRLDGIVKKTKAKKDIGIRFMKSWERDREIKEEGRKEGREEGRKEERSNTERERKRADKAEKRVAELEALLLTKS